jgi:hypothetical protein
VLVVDEVGPHHLDDDDRVQVLVKGEVCLVALATAEPAQSLAPGSDLVALLEPPGAGGVAAPPAVSLP